ncbi:BON domain-containing protein [Roseateles sp.]|uniref:BON domain-containing protein n=1 Tax=Roseateles sp. TaxID=1971397 RepID=UPI0031D9C67B
MRWPPAPAAHVPAAVGRTAAALIVFGLMAGPAQADDLRRNAFDDPFLQLTSAIPLSVCPAPPGPLLTEAEAKAQAHGRIERGTSCFQSGRCRLPNSYLYDKEIIPRVRQAVAADGRFDATTSVWALGQRRWVWLQGCVRSADEAAALEALVRQIDDVEAVINELQVLPGQVGASRAAPSAEPRPPAASSPSTR